MSRTRLTERTIAGQCGYASGRVFGWLFRRTQEMADAKDYDLLNAIDLQTLLPHFWTLNPKPGRFLSYTE
jgi:hypothetical protein